jgi:sugar/nucleoside kinase (ribokinase family)
MPPYYLSFSTLIIDDIVLWDGRTFMGVLGGSGPHALAGMRVWSDQLGLVATVGEDFAPAQRAQLTQLGVDLQGLLVRSECPTVRAWQLVEQDDRRVEVFHTPITALVEYAPQLADMPVDYQQARGIHLLWGRTFAELRELVTGLVAANPQVTLVWEPYDDYLHGGVKDFRPILEQLALFSPDIDQARAITGAADVRVMAQMLLEWGAPRVAIRIGAQGSWVQTQQGEQWAIPAVPPAQVVDVTGAGNSYCGGFLVGLSEGLDPLEAALRAAVSASFALEQFGLPTFTAQTAAEAWRRLAWARQQLA